MAHALTLVRLDLKHDMQEVLDFVATESAAADQQGAADQEETALDALLLHRLGGLHHVHLGIGIVGHHASPC